MGVGHPALYVFQHGDHRVCRAVCFGQRIGIFFLNHIADLCGIRFPGCEHFSQSFEEAFGLFADNV